VVRDDGIGFDERNNRSELQVGLKIMRERAEQIGAKVDVVTEVDQGTTVTLRVPAAKPSKLKEGQTASLS
jgi:two-component system nitrate/nitrite sensor histidine kinase NarX